MPTKAECCFHQKLSISAGIYATQENLAPFEINIKTQNMSVTDIHIKSINNVYSGFLRTVLYICFIYCRSQPLS